MNERGLEGRLAIVTGGSGGIGRASARALAEAGAEVLVWDVSAEALERTQDDLGADGLAMGALLEVECWAFAGKK